MSSRWFRPTVTLPVAVGAVFFVAGVVQVANNWPVIGDWAVAELIVRHLGRHLPLSGPYSATRGYNHPLPWVYAIEWLPYRFAGSRSSAAPAMALWWNGAWASFVVWMLARRKANGLAVIALAALLIMASSIEGVVLLLPWNPNLAVVPAFALLFVSWRVAIGESRFLPLSVGLGIWCAGANLAFLPFAAVLVLVVAGNVPMKGQSLVRALVDSQRQKTEFEKTMPLSANERIDAIDETQLTAALQVKMTTHCEGLVPDRCPGCGTPHPGGSRYMRRCDDCWARRDAGLLVAA